MTDGAPPPERARRFLNAVRDGEDGRAAVADLSESALDRLTHDERLAFWVTVYNAFVQDTLARRPDRYADRSAFFGDAVHTVAGTDISLDTIEHGILRGSKWKYGLGYVPNLRPGGFERRHRFASVDPRVHCALNCGAASCPAVAGYTPASIDDDLDAAVSGFLETTTDYDRSTNVLRVSRVFLWYRGDFGGGRGVRRFLDRYDTYPNRRPNLRYDEWDWSMKRGVARRKRSDAERGRNARSL